MAEHVILIIGLVALTLTMIGLIMRGYEAKRERTEEEIDAF